MNPVTKEWIEKAEADFAVAQRESRPRKSPNYDAVCFHAQQCAEKYLKALLHDAQIRFAKTHDLTALIGLGIHLFPQWELLREPAKMLTEFAVRFRYPGAWAEKAEARAALEGCKLIRAQVRPALGLPNGSRSLATPKRRNSRKKR